MPRKHNSLKCGGIFDKVSIESAISSLQKKSVEPNFWSNNQSAQKILKKISVCENELKILYEILKKYEKFWQNKSFCDRN